VLPQRESASHDKAELPSLSRALSEPFCGLREGLLL